MKHPVKPVSRRGRSGFSLVATLLMMMLLMMIALGTLSLSAITIRKTENEKPLFIARANARIALMMALGEVQEHLGPDQRVSGGPRIASRGKGRPANPHWVSVWRTTREDGKPWITRRGDKGGLSDGREAQDWDSKSNRIAILVSGNENRIHYTDDQEVDPKESVVLVGKGSLGEEPLSDGEVRAPLVGLYKNQKRDGAYAWWVGDLGTRANIATQDPHASKANGSIPAQMLAQDSSWQAFGDREIPEGIRGALANESQLGLFDRNLKDRHFHDFTVWSAGLPVNVRDGGWRRDLSAYLESDGSIPDLKDDGAELPGLADTDSLVGPLNNSVDRHSPDAGEATRITRAAPKFGLLRNWAGRSQGHSMGNFTANNELGDIGTVPTGGGNSKAVDIYKRTKSQLMPVLVEGSMYYNVSYYAPAKPPVGNPFALRVHYYPRVALWNPYNFALKVPESAIFMHINGSKWIEVTLQGGRKMKYRMYWGRGGSATGGSTRGSMFFKMDGATIEPGETMVWSPSSNRPYSESSYGSNTLSAGVGPSPQRAFYQDSRSDGYGLFTVDKGRPPDPSLLNDVAPAMPIDWREIVPAAKTSDLQAEAYTQADDYFMSWKPLTGTFTDTNFSSLPMGRFISCAYQYGDEDEMPVEWTAVDPVPMTKSTLAAPTVTQLPDRRTRDGFRLRWFDETPSNRLGSGSLANTPHLEDSAIGNWNMRASWSFRNPFENVTDVAPNFFGIYTRDLFDGETDWTGMTPRSSGGKFLGNPFDQPVRGPSKRILFDIPRKGAEIASLGAFQHVGFSEFIWHPTYALGNSLADPRVPIRNTEPDRSERMNSDKGGWNQDSIGFSLDGRSGNDNGATNDADNWAWTARNFFQQAALDQTLIYDLSFELNNSLWDSYFLSSGTRGQKDDLLENRFNAPLPNGRIMPNPMAGKIESDDFSDYHRAASKMLIEGAFNVNSTSVDAWEALLLSGVNQGHGDKVAFPRFLNAPGTDWDGNNPTEEAAWSGQRTVSRMEIRRLAEQIVEEVEKRGPFLGLSDFVNRRLSAGETGHKGALQAAIDRSGINSSFQQTWPLDNTRSLSDYKHVDHISDPTRMEQTLKPDTTAWGGLGFLTQADLLQYIGPALSARSDTFRIRGYGECRDRNGKVLSQAWCEAVVQRSPNYVDGNDNALKLPDALNDTNKKFGRRFEMVSFRWLKREEI